MSNEHSDLETLGVVKNHLDAVLSGDPAAMAVDYAESAVLIRGTDIYSGITEIENYFKSLPERMHCSKIEFFEPQVSGKIVTFQWKIQKIDMHFEGLDTLVISNGKIVKHLVELLSEDF
ncbi:MAG: nuclear transport factor 2 family protein [Actinomycetota bacterium]|nr:nuclear transport factor 2 family protein [Actinomycetota bacterium]MEC7366833.1 nuclear transport factor 2 family protein [Actinomycetota bacterium]MEC7578741.1 nuclear transport factor 2 family protein [Actinomycetota bacterium]MEC7715761.1 nuclear transport factor 2 family protein [Actinomycetota bacterium]MEC8119409.1 nuclear transport factor 2 family protein [Actinomycetota bacterium]